MVSIKDLKETDLFKGLNRKELKLLSKHFTEKNFEAGDEGIMHRCRNPRETDETEKQGGHPDYGEGCRDIFQRTQKYCQQSRYFTLNELKALRAITSSNSKHTEWGESLV
jgi:hypothetical protein